LICGRDHCSRCLPAVPGAAEQKERENGPPHRADEKAGNSEQGATDQSKDAGNLQAADFSERIPEQTADDLSAIEGKNRQQIKNEQAVIDQAQLSPKHKAVTRGSQRVLVKSGGKSGSDNRNESNIDQRAGGDTPEIGAGPSRRTYKCDAAERPKNNAIGYSTDLTAG
jgi:hypothetical protein